MDDGLADPIGRAARDTADLARGVYEKAAEDDIFFMAGAIAFNVLVAFVPLALTVVGIAGVVLQRLDPDASQVLLDYILGGIPEVSREFRQEIEQGLVELIGQSTRLLSLGAVFLLWVSTRLVGTLRSVLREVFDVQRDRGMVAGKLFDLKMVLAAGTLFTVNVGLTILLEIAARIGTSALGLQGWPRETLESWYGPLAALVTIWVMFLLIYRYLPARRTRWRTALIAATFTAVLFELLKQAFSWYATDVANYGSTYGTLGALVILIFWIYYTSVVFILGGEVAQVAAMRRIRRRQKERLS